MEFPLLETLKNRRTLKWTRYTEGVPLWVAESDFPTFPRVKEVLHDAVRRETFGYPPDYGSQTHPLHTALSGFYSRAYGAEINPDWVAAIPDVVRGLYLGIKHFTKPDSGIIVPLPAYPPFIELPKATGRPVFYVPVSPLASAPSKDSEHDLFPTSSDDSPVSHNYGLDLEAVESAFQQGAGSLLLCNPHNPLGIIFPEDHLRDLCNLAHRYDARIIVDEIHAPLCLDSPHTVTATLSETAAQVCLTVTATSKAWNIAGLKCAQMIVTNEEDWNTWKKLSPIHKDGVSILGLLAAEVCYREGESYLEEVLAQIRHNRDYLLHALPDAVPGISLPTQEATYLMFLDFTQTPLADHPARILREQGGIILNEGLDFGAPGAGHARLNFACSPATLDDAVTVMREVYQRLR